jgi:hypothetical protein
MRTDKIKSIIIIDKQHETNSNIFLLRDKTGSRLAKQGSQENEERLRWN